MWITERDEKSRRTLSFLAWNPVDMSMLKLWKEMSAHRRHPREQPFKVAAGWRGGRAREGSRAQPEAGEVSLWQQSPVGRGGRVMNLIVGCLLSWMWKRRVLGDCETVSQKHVDGVMEMVGSN